MIKKYASTLVPVALSTVSAAVSPVFAAGAGGGVERGDFSRDVLSGRASILIIGDSTNNPRGAGLSTPYYEGLLRRLPPEVPVCGFRISGSTGGTGVNNYVSFVGGAVSQMEGGWIYQKGPLERVVFTSDYIPPGYRNSFKLVSDGSLPDGGRFAVIAMRDLAEISPAAAVQWLGSDVVMRTSVVVGPDGAGMLGSIAVQPMIQQNASAGTLTPGELTHVDLASDAWGIVPIDVRFSGDGPAGAGLDFGVQFTGDLDDDDADEAGKTMSWCDHSVFVPELAEFDTGLVLDSVSIGGFTGYDHYTTLQEEALIAYTAAMPRLPTWIVVWLGQNIELDEWGAGLNPVFSDRIEAIADRAVEAVHANQPGRDVRVALVNPPQASGTYPWHRFVQIGDALEVLAADRGWAYVDLFGELRETLEWYDVGHTNDGIHPSLSGSEYASDVLYDSMRCWSVDTNGDGTLDFFDIADYIGWYGAGDPRADLDGISGINFFDVAMYLSRFSEGCGG